MAVIGKIREKSGLLLVIIGVALAAFVMGDLFSNLGKGRNVDQSKVALINDEKIPTQEFNLRVSEQSELTMQQLKKNNLTPEETYQNVMDVWSVMKRETILRQQMLELGLIQTTGASLIPSVTMDEYMDNINGQHPHAEIVRNFSDPNTGAFDPSSVTNFLNYLEQGVVSEDQKQREQALQSESQWKLLTKYIKNDISTVKYNNLITKAYYMPKALAEADFNDNNTLNKVAFFGANYKLVTDEEAIPTDADYLAYYEEHKNEFKAKEETRKMEYIIWDVRPTDKDIQDLQTQISELSEDLRTAEKASIAYVVNRAGENNYDSAWVKPGSLSPFIDSAAFASEPGTMLGPWSENSAYHIARVVDQSLRPDSMKASHILISYAGAYGAAEGITRTKIGARALADSINDVLNAEKSLFSEMVIKSDDPSAKENNGELGWFADGSMIPEFNKACLNGTKGEISVVETSFGFHVIRIDDKKELTPKIRIAQINLPITFSQETFNEVYGQAIKFAAVNQNYDAFDTASANMGLNVVKGDYVNNMAKGLNNLTNSRDVVKWMFEESTTKGTVSTVFDFENKVMVGVVTDIKPKGILPLETVKEDIKVLVVRDVKAKILAERMNKVTDLSQASEFDAKIDSITLSFATYSLPNYGPEQNVQGRMASADENKLMGPIKGDQALYFFKVIEKGEAPSQKDLKSMQQRSVGMFGQRVSTAAYQALEEQAEIDDFLFLFY